MLLSSFVSFAASFAFAAALSPITRKGAALFDSSGNRFYLKGVAYSANYGSSQTAPTDSISKLDPLANAQGCQRDVPYFTQLGINVIRVYQVNATLNHDTCMQALSKAGIYVLLDLATPAPNDAINTVAPSWNVGLMTNFITTVEAFGNYDNVLGFNVGNEVISSLADDDSAPYIKAAARDMKEYISTHGYTQLVGYTATDSPNSRVNLAEYLACNTTDTSIDFWGLNIYEWCGNSSFAQSGYQARTQEIASINIPAFFSEYGCNAVSPRQFQDVPTLYSTDMSGVWSGGIVYEYQMESNAFGLVNISSDGSSVTTTPDFDNLKAQYAAATGPQTTASSYSANTTQPACPATDPTNWPVALTLPPTPNQDVCGCVSKQLSCVSTYNSGTDLGVIGKAIGTVCGQSQAACAAIASNGTTGTYGSLSHCDPLTQLNIALDSYYNSQGRSSDACAFGGVATLTTGGPTATDAVASATASCLAAGFAQGTGVPSPTMVPSGFTTHAATAPTGGSGSGSGGSGAGKNGTSHGNGAPGTAAAASAGMLVGSAALALLSGLALLA